MKGWLYAGGALLALVIIISLLPFTTVDTGERVVVVRLGKVDRVLGQGFHWVNPFLEDTHTYDIRQQKEEVEASAASKDLQSITAKVAVNYELNPERVGELYTTLKSDFKNRVIDPSVQEAVKASTAKYTAEESVTKRELVKTEIKRALAEQINNKSNGLIIVKDVSLTNFDFSPQFNAAIEAKVRAEQEALKAKNDLERVKFEAEQQIAKAHAEAQSIRLQSDAANNPRYVELKQLEVQLEFAKKWNGQLPTNLYGSAPIPFLQLGGN